MNYPEYVLRRSETLWRELEKAWQRELTTMAGVTRGDSTDAENVETENADRGNAGGANAVKRFAGKLSSAENESAAKTMGELSVQERETRFLAEAHGTSNATGENGVQWLAEKLRHSAAEGILFERVQKHGEIFAPTYETADLQTLSQSVERDARRYDSGFLLY